MFKFRTLLVACIFFASTAVSIGQTLSTDTVKIMTYNVGSYGKSPSGSCPLLSLTYKSPWLKTILQYEKPDIVGMVKMEANSVIATTTVIQDVLDSVCNGCYGHSVFTDISGDSKVSMLYFNTNKFGFVSTTSIYTADPNIDDINLHKLYYQNSNLSTTHDTIFLNIVLVHLFAGSTGLAERDSESVGAMNWLNANITTPENLIVMGDFNSISSSEGGYSTYTTSSNINTQFYDVADSAGDWTSFPRNFAKYLTQNTRLVDPGDCNSSTGGMANWFDHILCTAPMMNGTDSIKYIPGSFTVIGNDGQHTFEALVDTPANSSVPADVDTALYYMSEHVPVFANFGITYTSYAGINELSEAAYLYIEYNTIATDRVTILAVKSNIQSFLSNCEATIYDLQGKIISASYINLNQQNSIDISATASGMYLLRIKKNGTPFFNGKILKI